MDGADEGDDHQHPPHPPIVDPDAYLRYVFGADGGVVVELNGDDDLILDDTPDDTNESASSSSSESPGEDRGREGEGVEEGEGVGVEEDMGIHASRPRRRRSITFNQDLPPTHPYLGTDLEDVGGGASWLEADSVLDNVPIFPVPNLILMPGQTLPLQSLHPRRIAMFRTLIEHHHVFAVITMRSNRTDLLLYPKPAIGDVGTLAQVVAFKEEQEDVMTSLKIRAVGRQRFKLLDLKRTIDGSPCGKVVILPEIRLDNALNCVIPPCWKRFRLNTKWHQKYKFLGAHLTPMPAVVFKQNDMEEICEDLVSELSQWYDPWRVSKLAEDRTDFSFWVAGNLPVDDETKLQLLTMDCALQRLRFELHLIRKCEDLCCRTCAAAVCKKRDVFSMSVDGPMGAYVNPGGHVHEMLTVHQVQKTAIVSRGRSSTENTWFPGYAWTIQECGRCGAHMGWKFGAKERGLHPKKFWGLTRAAIWPLLQREDQSSAAVEEPSPLPTNELPDRPSSSI